jgi:hypothetical protein
MKYEFRLQSSISNFKVYDYIYFMAINIIKMSLKNQYNYTYKKLELI